MNVYDFDQTVFWPDSSYCFVKYCLRHYPRAVLRSVPELSLTAIRLFMKDADTRELKEQVFSFLPGLDDVEQIVQDFWDEHRENVEDWYLRQKRPDDLIISASPEFLLRPICEELGIRLIATRMDPYSGKIQGPNCHDTEKVRRFRLEYPEGKIDSFYSDSLSDSPLAELAEQAFLVKKGSLQPWPEQN